MEPPILSEALTAYRRDVHRSGYAIEDVLAPGLDGATVVETLIEVGIEPIDELVQWFQFSNGLVSSPKVQGIFDGLHLLSLHEAIALRTSLATAGDLHPSDKDGTWLPIAGGKPTVLVDTSPGRQGVVREYWWDEDARDSDPSLAAWIERQRSILSDRGLWHPSPWQPCHEVSFALGEAELSRRGERQLSNVIKRLEELGYQRIQLRHAAIGSLDGNGNLEVRQLDIVLSRLATAGISPEEVETLTSEADQDNADGRQRHAHTLVFSCLPDLAFLDR